MFGNTPPAVLIPIVVVVFFGIGLHEYAHCKFADMAGDPTPRIYGRVTLDLTKHFELMGTLMMLFTAQFGLGIGWGKPAPMDPDKMRNPRWDFFAAVAAGPISNVVQAVLYGLVARLMIVSGQTSVDQIVDALNVRFLDNPQSVGVLPALLAYGVLLNLSLALFNLFPIGPLDGQWLLGLLMPDRARDKWWWWNRRYGWYLLMALVLGGQIFFHTSVLGLIIGPAVIALTRLILGF
ncbi:site-2 protease family protein [Fimbriimonas ginsengisoli]|uniref:Membrane metalloprotease n=1 Tax=Fimbriimonas ginsengisoli Gsoil 348 TaxID=661478 RepID=A0A068NJ08_FIMGI|nr:site-2 protease family protein [Fimbriimonas ginsengisoli]AIE83452.1 membrane metalloprotease [Fimbriimonas ginsengisoli Gsoil 348]